MTETVVSILALTGFTALMVSGCAAPRAVEGGRNYVILVGHGVPASDYPKERLREWFRMSEQAHAHAAQGNEHEQVSESTESEYAQRTREIVYWPRTPENDPYKFAVERLAEHLAEQIGRPVLAAFNEFCAPTVQEAIDRTVQEGAEKIVVISTMMTSGSDHSEVDIPQSVEAARGRHPNVEITYAWPYDPNRIAAMFADHITAFDCGQR